MTDLRSSPSETVFKQEVIEEPIKWRYVSGNIAPLTIIGDNKWTDYSIYARFLLNATSGYYNYIFNKI